MALNSAGLGSQVKVVGIYPLSRAEVVAAKDGWVLASFCRLGSPGWAHSSVIGLV